jgi:hypothetical protein
VPVSSLDATIDVTLWSPDDDSDSVPLPLVVVHDGPEYDERAALTHYLAAGITGGWLPRLRAALLSPGVERNHWYSANPNYTDAVASTVIPALADAVANTIRVGMGTSLGGLAMLHIQRTCAPSPVDRRHRHRLHRRRSRERHHRSHRQVDAPGRVSVFLHYPVPARIVLHNSVADVPGQVQVTGVRWAATRVVGSDPRFPARLARAVRP